MKKTLIIEDDKDIAQLVKYNLAQEGLDSEIASTGEEGLNKARRLLPHLVILDLMLPDKSGFEICKTLKQDIRTKGIPIMMLTARSEEIDRIVGFEMGVDDYVTKPFHPRELVLRIKALLRRFQEPASAIAEKNPVSYKTIEMEPSKFQVLVGKKNVHLTAIEFKLLYYLISHNGRVATRDTLLDHVWGYGTALTTRTVDTHIKRLRAKLGKAGDYIETIRGIGYRMPA